MAATQTERRNTRIEALIAQGEQWAGKLTDQDDGVKRRAQALRQRRQGALLPRRARAHLSKIIKVDLAAELFSYDSTRSSPRVSPR